MAILVDTQIFIWSIISPNKLSNNIKELLQNNEVLVSYVSLFEIAIKQRIGKLSELSLTIDELVEQAKSDNFLFLEISTEHIASYNDVPFFADLHKDWASPTLLTVYSLPQPYPKVFPSFLPMKNSNCMILLSH
jgi:PIN domain nuclease of toxin-antitoxin system